MKAFTIAITAGVLVVMIEGSSLGQSCEVLQYVTGITVVRAEWYKNPPRPSWDHDAFSDITKPCIEANPLRSDSTGPQHHHFMLQPSTNSDSQEFVYRMTLRNGGEKTIRSVEWEYLFVDRETQAEVARHQFSSQLKVRPHRRKTVVEYSPSPPTKVISVRSLSQPASNQFIERVVIKRVTYEDGSVWKQ